MSILNALKGITNQFEINRIVGAFGATSYVVGAHVFVAHDVFIKGRVFDVATYCLAFPGGLAVAIGAIAGAVAIKDRSVATARVTSAKADTADAANAEAK